MIRMGINIKPSFLLAIRGMFICFLMMQFCDSFANSMEKITSKKTAEDIAKKLPSPRAKKEFQVHSVGLGIGQTILKSGFKEKGNDKVAWDLFYNYSASRSFDMLLNFHTSSHNRFKEGKQHEVRITGLAIGIKGKSLQFDSFSPFLLGGFGFYRPEVESPEVESLESKIVFGWHLGAGGELTLNKNFKISLLGHLHNPFDVEDDLKPGKLLEGHYLKFIVAVFYSFN